MNEKLKELFDRIERNELCNSRIAAEEAYKIGLEVGSAPAQELIGIMLQFADKVEEFEKKHRG